MEDSSAIIKHARSRACLACQKRKGKCDGNDPCSYCSKVKGECTYTTAKKRGPAPKKVKIGKFSIFASATEEYQFIPEINVIQDEMTKMYQKNNCIDFYFHFVGHVFPVSQRIRLYTRPRKSSRKVQLYVIFAHVSRFFGSTELSTKCIEEARSYAGEAFDDVSIDSAVAFIMMSLYLGFDDPRGRYYANMAYNIMKFPAVGTGTEVKEIHRLASLLGIMQEPTLSPEQRYSIVSSNLATEQGNLTLKEWVTVISCKICMTFRFKIMNKEISDVTAIGMLCDPTTISDEARDLLETEIGRLDDIAENKEIELGDLVSFVNFLTRFTKMILYWKIGERGEAVEYAKEASRVMLDNRNTIIVWLNNYLPNMLSICAVLDNFGFPEEAAELQEAIEEMCNKTGQKVKYDRTQQAWKASIKLLKGLLVEEIDDGEEIDRPSTPTFDESIMMPTIMSTSMSASTMSSPSSTGSVSSNLGRSPKHLYDSTHLSPVTSFDHPSVVTASNAFRRASSFDLSPSTTISQPQHKRHKSSDKVSKQTPAAFKTPSIPPNINIAKHQGQLNTPHQLPHTPTLRRSPSSSATNPLHTVSSYEHVAYSKPQDTMYYDSTAPILHNPQDQHSMRPQQQQQPFVDQATVAAPNYHTPPPYMFQPQVSQKPMMQQPQVLTNTPSYHNVPQQMLNTQQPYTPIGVYTNIPDIYQQVVPEPTPMNTYPYLPGMIPRMPSLEQFTPVTPQSAASFQQLLNSPTMFLQEQQSYNFAAAQQQSYHQ